MRLLFIKGDGRGAMSRKGSLKMAAKLPSTTVTVHWGSTSDAFTRYEYSGSVPLPSIGVMLRTEHDGRLHKVARVEIEYGRELIEAHIHLESVPERS